MESLMRLGQGVAKIDLDEVQSAECLIFLVTPGTSFKVTPVKYWVYDH